MMWNCVQSWILTNQIYSIFSILLAKQFYVDAIQIRIIGIHASELTWIGSAVVWPLPSFWLVVCCWVFCGGASATICPCVFVRVCWYAHKYLPRSHSIHCAHDISSICKQYTHTNVHKNQSRPEKKININLNAKNTQIDAETLHCKPTTKPAEPTYHTRHLGNFEATQTPRLDVKMLCGWFVCGWLTVGCWFSRLLVVFLCVLPCGKVNEFSPCKGMRQRERSAL